MDVTSATATTATPPPPAREAKAVLSSDFETFLKMLSTQLQNQDPLNPVDSADYAVQLATFSSVEQQVLTNTRLEELISRIQLSGMGDLANWVGMEALTTAGTPFNGTPVVLQTAPPPRADRAVLVVRDMADTVIQRMDIPVAAGPVEWDGETITGSTAPPGTYRFELESSVEGEPISINPVASYDRILEARRDGGETRLILSGGGTVSAAEVTGLRNLATSAAP